MKQKMEESGAAALDSFERVSQDFGSKNVELEMQRAVTLKTNNNLIRSPLKPIGR